MLPNESNKLLSEIVAFRTYAKYIPHLQRRETLQETTNRTMNMHLEKFPRLSNEITKAFSLVHELKIMPSMRSMQFSGEAISSNNARSYNCSFVNISYERSFSEILFLLLSGTGVGFSVQSRHISKLPVVRKPKEEGYYRVHDSIEGWAEALNQIINAYFYGAIRPDFDFSAIRPKGSYLVTTGAKAPGSEPLRHMLTQVDKMFASAVGRKLRPIEVHDIGCMIADCVLAGGIRRAALISLFDKDDDEMLKCKSGSWWEKHPYRARANNSVVLHRQETTKEEFDYIIKMCEESKAGEPGIFWTNDYDYGTNPCVTGDTVLEVKIEGSESKIRMKDVVQMFLDGKEMEVKSYDVESGEVIYSKITNAALTKKDAKLLRVTDTESGKSIRCTPDHKIFTRNRGWVEAQNLKSNDVLVIN